MKGLIDINQLSKKELKKMIDLASDIMENPNKYSEKCRGKKLATLFYEPSTRTRLSFEAAMLELGGSVLGFSEASSSSSTKGETIYDTAKVVSNYADIIAMRHHKEGAPLVAMQAAHIPVINAGDGGHKHPTQTLADLMTIYKKLGRLEALTIGVCGDLKYGRTVHSLVEAMKLYDKVKFVFVAPDELKIPDYIKNELSEESYEEVNSLEEALPKVDVLYMTRVQRERFENLELYEAVKDSFILDTEKMKLAKEKMAILHPLPRVNEIAKSVDDDPRAAYFEQTLYGKYMRMALILQLLNLDDENAEFKLSYEHNIEVCERICKNKQCISLTERGIKHIIKGNYKKKSCIYCEKEV